MLWFGGASTKVPDQDGLLLRGPGGETCACMVLEIQHQSRVQVFWGTYVPYFALYSQASGMPQTGYSFGEKDMFEWNVLEVDWMKNKIVPSFPTAGLGEAVEIESR